MVLNQTMILLGLLVENSEFTNLYQGIAFNDAVDSSSTIWC